MADGQVVFATELDAAGIKQGLDGLGGTINKWGAAVVGSKAFQMISDGLIKVAKAGIEYNAQMEAYQTNFGVLLGDQAAALEHVAELREMAAKTPFGMEDLANASQTLLSFGMGVDGAMDSLKMLGDISLGNQERFSSLSLAFAQVSSAGKLTGQDLLQMINAGFNPLNTIAEKTGTNLGDLKDVMGGGKGSKEFQKQMKAAQKEVKKLGDQASEGAKLLAQIGAEGAISAEMVGIAMQAETSPGGRFYNGMEKASQTKSGLWSTLKDDASQLAGNAMQSISDSIAERLLPAAIMAVGALNELFEPKELEVSADVQSAIEELNKIDETMLRIMNDYASDTIKIKVEYDEANDLIAKLEEKFASLQDVPKRLWSDQDKEDLLTLTSQLVDLNPAFESLVGKDGIIKNDIQAIRELADEYYNLAVVQAAQEARTEAIKSVVEAKQNRDVLIETNKLLETQRTAAWEASNAWLSLAQGAETMQTAFGAETWKYSGGFFTETDAAEKALGYMRQYIELSGGIDSQAFSDAGVDVSAFMNGLNLMSAEELAGNAEAIRELGEAMAVINSSAVTQGQGQQTIISQLNTDISAINAAVAESETVIASAELRLQALENHIADLEAGKASLNVSEEAASANEAIASVQEAGDALGASNWSPVLDADDQATAKISSVRTDLQKIDGESATVFIKYATSGRMPGILPNVPGFAEGLNYVPYDNYLAYLHKGEMVLTADEAAALRQLSSGDYASRLASRVFTGGGEQRAVGGETIVHQTINFNQPVQTPDEFAQMLKMYATYGLADA